MDRAQPKRQSTLIDPASLHTRPTANRMDSSNTQSDLNRRGSRSGQPLLSFDDDGHLEETGIRDSRLPKTKSVFGVDTLWEREMLKLKEIEAEEKREAEERKRMEDELEAKMEKRRKQKEKEKREKREKMGTEPRGSIRE